METRALLFAALRPLTLLFVSPPVGADMTDELLLGEGLVIASGTFAP
jgi:hypothetical protein